MDLVENNKNMDMTEEEHAKMSAEEKNDPKKMDMTKEEHAKMQHSNLPMGTTLYT